MMCNTIVVARRMAQIWVQLTNFEGTGAFQRGLPGYHTISRPWRESVFETNITVKLDFFNVCLRKFLVTQFSCGEIITHLYKETYIRSRFRFVISRSRVRIPSSASPHANSDYCSDLRGSGQHRAASGTDRANERSVRRNHLRR